jgi:DNA (cytosine-5)-methyltransferase 1
MKAVELFAGAGGLALGAARIGVEHEALIEWNSTACDTIRANMNCGHGLVEDWPVFEADVREFDYGTISAEIDMVAGGPPCQPFSLGGKHGGQKDERNMFPAAVRAIRELQPKAFVFENVRGLLRKSFRDYFEYILLQLSFPELKRQVGESWTDHKARIDLHRKTEGRNNLTYRVEYALLNAADFGVPQNRYRVFIVGYQEELGTTWTPPAPTHAEDVLLYQQWVTGEYWDRHDIPNDERPEFPSRYRRKVRATQGEMFEPTLEPWRTVRDALCDLPDPRSHEEASRYHNHEFSDGAKVYPGHTGSPLDWPSKTLKAGDHGVPGGENMIAYYDGTVRYYSVREAARIQTFPDEYRFPGTWTGGMKQLGNAVPVKLAETVVESVVEQLPVVEGAVDDQPTCEAVQPAE